MRSRAGLLLIGVAISVALFAGELVDGQGLLGAAQVGILVGVTMGGWFFVIREWGLRRGAVYRAEEQRRAAGE